MGKVIVDAIRKHRDTEPEVFLLFLLCENGWNKKLDGSLLISCSAEKQIQRLYKRDGFLGIEQLVLSTVKYLLSKK